MRLRIVAVGRLRSGPEKTLFDEYVDRFQKLGRGLGFHSLNIVEVEDRKADGIAAEAALLHKAIPAGATVICLDERGKNVSSPDFAQKLARFRDSGHAEVVCIIGGADGIGADILARADLTVSLGKMVWPHMLVRVMLAEQLYRAASILAGHPYHRA